MDQLWSAKVKENAGNKCEICGSEEQLEAHHIHRCKHHGVRWNVINGACLCRDCHCNNDYSAHKNQVWFFMLITTQRGEVWAEELARATIEDKNWRDRLVQIKEDLK